MLGIKEMNVHEILSLPGRLSQPSRQGDKRISDNRGGGALWPSPGCSGSTEGPLLQSGGQGVSRSRGTLGNILKSW